MSTGPRDYPAGTDNRKATGLQSSRNILNAFQEWRKRERQRTQLCRLTDSELVDFGNTRGEIDYAIPHCSTGWRHSGIPLVAMLCTACICLCTREASAQCTAQDVLQNQLRLKKNPPAAIPQILVKSAADVPVWKTITVGTFADTFAIRNALDAAGCSIGDFAGQILARPAFTLSVRKTSVELFAVSAAELGFETDTVSLAAFYARAQLLGFGLAAAEAGPQLRLQYFDQPIGEFLTIGMEPIRTWNGERAILTVANGGAGLTLFGQDGSADAQISVASRFLFVRAKKVAPAEEQEAKALAPH
jgi:uncharacterized protein YjiS (DUF1127 family)